MESKAIINTVNEYENPHILHDTWTLWAHLPKDTDWSLASYKKILTFNTIEDLVGLKKVIPKNMYVNCMLFLMKEGISPTWEDAQNREGGCFSYKISTEHVEESWDNLTKMIIGNTLVNNKDMESDINGITISPKRNFCIVKVWMASCNYTKPTSINTIHKSVSNKNVIFKQHDPEY